MLYLLPRLLSIMLYIAYSDFTIFFYTWIFPGIHRVDFIHKMEVSYSLPIFLIYYMIRPLPFPFWLKKCTIFCVVVIWALISIFNFILFFIITSKAAPMFESDDRFKAVERDRDRRDLFDSFMEELANKVGSSSLNLVTVIK